MPESMAAEWLRLATAPATVRRACTYAVVVGAVLITINHGDAILAGDLSAGRLLRMGLTVLVPYLVSTFSSVGATLERDRASREPGPTARTRAP
jgi:hypothetical protein